MLSTLLWVTVVVWGLFTATWLVALVRRDASTIDWIWAPGFAVIAWSTDILSTSPAEPMPGVTLVVLFLITAWGIRLGSHLITRNLHHGEDRRYAELRKKGGPGWFLRSYVTVFLLQGALMLVVSVPVIVLIVQAGEGSLSAWPLYLGAGITLAGIVIEGLADHQLKLFRKSWSNAGKVLQTGLWRYSRHPNYFGNALMWWGFWIMSLAVPAGIWTVFSPILMTVLLLRVSGVPMLEAPMVREKAGYADYVARTSAFIPWFPGARD